MKADKYRGGEPSESFFKCPLYRLEGLSLLFYSLTAFAHVQSSHRCYTSSVVTLYLNHDMTYVMNMKEVLFMFVTTVICLSLSYDILNANRTLFEMSLL